MPDPAKWGEAAVNLMAFEPVIGDDVVPVLPIEGIAAGAGAGVDVLVGTTTEEMRFFLVPPGAIGFVTDDMLRGAVGAYGIDADAALAAYADAGELPGDVLAAVATDWFFRIPAIRLAEVAAGRGDRVHVYEFAWRSPAFDGALGACHAIELGFVFDNLAAPGDDSLQGSAPPQALAGAMHGAWVSLRPRRRPGLGGVRHRHAARHALRRVLGPGGRPARGAPGAVGGEAVGGAPASSEPGRNSGEGAPGPIMNQ